MYILGKFYYLLPIIILVVALLLFGADIAIALFMKVFIILLFYINIFIFNLFIIDLKSKYSQLHLGYENFSKIFSHSSFHYGIKY